MNALSRRLTFDAVLTALLVIEMFIQFTGVFAHEIIGAAFFAGLAVHLACERAWLKAVMTKRSFAHAHAIKLGIAIALTIIAVALGASSLAISTILNSAGISLLTFVPLATWSTIHAASAYALCIATVVHLVAHWSLVARVAKIPYDPSRRAAIGTGVGMIAGGCAMAIGIAGARATNAASLLGGVAAAATEPTASASSVPASAVSFGGGVSDAGVGEGAAKAAAGSAGTAAGTAARVETAAGSAGSASAAASSSSTENATSQDGASLNSSPSSDDGSSTQATGTCPLCPKNCPLSAPRCNRPYEAGLISA